MSGVVNIPILEISQEEFRKVMTERREPLVLRGSDLGSCTRTWSPEILSEKLNPRQVKVHVGQDQDLDFRTKNFKYCDIDIKELVKRAQNKTNEEFFIDKSEVYYLRSISGDARNLQVSNLDQDFPEISSDFKIPDLFPPDQMFSSVLRISSGGVRIWTHYDVTDNVYCQIIGRKSAVLWPPSQANNMYLQGDKSMVADIDSPGSEFPLFPVSNRWKAELEPGDILFIPSLWFHNMKAHNFGVAVNVFWKELESKFYDPKECNILV